MARRTSRPTTTLRKMTRAMRWRPQTLFAAACMASLVFLLLHSSGKDAEALEFLPLHGAAKSSKLPCLDLPGASDTVVVLRTGSTELQDKLPVHLSTTLQCYPNHLVFSDYEETYQGEPVVDALSSVTQQILDDHPDFELHRRLKQLGRSALLASELSGTESEAIQWHGKTENPGWKLDKWKFLPMVNRTFSEFPDKKWYIFVEADSFIFWRSTLQYLALLDHTEPHYSGSQMFIGDVLFAHGGSGFFVSQPAMKMVVDFYASHQEEIEKFTDGHWAGDCVLGKVFKDAGVPFTNSWPIFQGDYPGIVPYAKPDGRPVADVKTRVWCYPTISYHHLSPEIVEDLWYFEQRWFKSHPVDSDAVLRHKDVFHSYILPNMSASRTGWDNESDSDEGIVSSVDACKAKCEEDSQCRQYSFDNERRCRTRTDPRLGKAISDIESGWLPDRMVTFDQQMAPCGDEGWMF